MSVRFPVVFVDLDGTLLPQTTVSALTAAWLGRRGALDELERRYRAGQISNAVLAETSAGWFAGRNIDEISEALLAACWIEGIADTVARLRSAGAYVALATVSWRFAAEVVAERYGFDACSGTEMALEKGRLTGVVSRSFDAEDKAAFVDDVCARQGVPTSAAAAIGDSRSDLPTFARVGFSIALNADDAAREAATVSLDTEDLRDVLPLLLEPPADKLAMTRSRDLEAELQSILLADHWFVDVLRAIRHCDPPNWVVGSGVVRNIVWDHLHGFERRTPVKDVDVAIFDPTDPSRGRDEELEAELQGHLPAVPWEVTNQAGVHLWYEREFGTAISPIRSIEDAVSRWPETATAVAVKLLNDDRLDVVAPFGLDDLLQMVLRRNPKQVTREYFRRRVQSKKIRQTWPKVTVIDEEVLRGR
jgi:HAD superfamily phosphoserine phosphatase-like hydrolase